MLNITRLKLAVLGLLSLAATDFLGCFPSSENPIVVDRQERVDTDLLGIWYGTFDEDDDRFYLHIINTDSERDESLPGGVGRRFRFRSIRLD